MEAADRQVSPWAVVCPPRPGTGRQGRLLGRDLAAVRPPDGWADATRESLTLRRASPAALHVNTLHCGLGVPEASLGAAGPDTHLFPISDAVVREGHGPSSALSGCSGRDCSTCLATATGSRTVGPSGAGRGWLGARGFWTLAAGRGLPEPSVDSPSPGGGGPRAPGKEALSEKGSALWPCRQVRGFVAISCAAP